jgi:hypothetical protein
MAIQVIQTKPEKQELLKNYIKNTNKLVKPTQILITEGISYATGEKKYVKSRLNVLRVGLVLNIDTQNVGKISRVLYEVDHPDQQAMLVEVREFGKILKQTQWQWSPRLSIWLKLNDDVQGLYQK